MSDLDEDVIVGVEDYPTGLDYGGTLSALARRSKELQELELKKQAEANQKRDFSNTQVGGLAGLGILPLLIGAAVGGKRGLHAGAVGANAGMQNYTGKIEKDNDKAEALAKAEAAIYGSRAKGLQSEMTKLQSGKLLDDMKTENDISMQNRSFSHAEKMQNRSFSQQERMEAKRAQKESKSGKSGTIDKDIRGALSDIDIIDDEVARAKKLAQEISKDLGPHAQLNWAKIKAQGLVPANKIALLESMLKPIALRQAAILNQGRPSDKDMQAVVEFLAGETPLANNKLIENLDTIPKGAKTKVRNLIESYFDSDLDKDARTLWEKNKKKLGVDDGSADLSKINTSEISKEVLENPEKRAAVRNAAASSGLPKVTSPKDGREYYNLGNGNFILVEE